MAKIPRDDSSEKASTGGRGGWSERDRLKALKTIRDVRDGKGGRNAQARIVAAKLIKDETSGGPTLATASDVQLLAEVSRRGLVLSPVDLDAAEQEVSRGR